MASVQTMYLLAQQHQLANAALTASELNAVDANGQTALGLACSRACMDAVTDLIAHGADVNRDRSFKGYSPLHWASMRGAVDIVQLLLLHNAVLDRPAINGFTPLILAARQSHVEVARVLLDAGANPFRVDRLGRTALDWAVKPEMVRLLRRAMAYDDVEEAAPVDRATLSTKDVPRPLDQMIFVLQQSLNTRRTKRLEREAMLRSSLRDLERRALADDRTMAELEQAKAALTEVHGAEIALIQEQEQAAEISLAKLQSAFDLWARKVLERQWERFTLEDYSTLLSRCGITGLTADDFQWLCTTDLSSLSDEALQDNCPSLKFAQRFRLLHNLAFLRFLNGEPPAEFFLLDVAPSGYHTPAGGTVNLTSLGTNPIVDVSAMSSHKLETFLIVEGIDPAVASRLCRDEDIDGALLVQLTDDDFLTGLGLDVAQAERVLQVRNQAMALSMCARLLNSSQNAGVDSIQLSSAVLRLVLEGYAAAQCRLSQLREAVGELREDFSCPITHELLKDAVVAMDGFTYERSAITHWNQHHSTSPMTRQVMLPLLLPNLCVRRAVERCEELQRGVVRLAKSAAAAKSAGEEQVAKRERAKKRHRHFVAHFQDVADDGEIEIGMFHDWSSDEEDAGEDGGEQAEDGPEMEAEAGGD